MRNFIRSLMLVGWFFGVQSPLEDYPGGIIQSVLGPFKTKAECEAYRNTTEAQLSSLIANLKVTACQELKNA